MTGFKEKFEEYIGFVEAELKGQNVVTNKNEIYDNLIKAMNYSLEAGGKRIRPVLVYAFCEACGGDIAKAAAPAAAIEMIHTFSLIHDDLPAMDNDDFRRGKPSCHKAFGEAMAILAGDALAVKPFELIATDGRLTAPEKVRIIGVLAGATGGMIGGQVIDMENEQKTDVDEAALSKMYIHKTGELIAASCAIGCICAGADDATVKSALTYGYNLGLAFQIIDDILDVTSTTEELGKPVGSDEEENKTTFVTLHGVEGAREHADKITEKAMACLEAFGNDEFLTELTEMLLKRKN